MDTGAEVKGEDEGEIVLARMLEVERWVKLGGQLVGGGGDGCNIFGLNYDRPSGFAAATRGCRYVIDTITPYSILSITTPFHHFTNEISM